MTNILMSSTDKKIEIFEEMTMATKIKQSIVEKDLWVTWVLGKIFADEALSKIMMLKGGTSLSKVFHLINRFSEDIDLAFDWRLIANQKSFEQELSKTQQDKFNKQINEMGRQYIKDNLLPVFQNILAPFCECVIGEDENCIMVQYPKLFTDDYVKPIIMLEIGVFTAWFPSDTYEIKSFVAEQFPNLFKNPAYKVKAINAERTFWEKATILHQEVNRSQNKLLPTRYARHYYDLAMMAKNNEVKDKALNNFALLKDVVKFKQKFYPTNWAQYNEIESNELKLLPQDFRLKELEKDYQAMQNMIFGVKPTFDEIIEILKALEQEIAIKRTNNNSISNQTNTDKPRKPSK